MEIDGLAKCPFFNVSVAVLMVRPNFAPVVPARTTQPWFKYDGFLDTVKQGLISDSHSRDLMFMNNEQYTVPIL